MATPITAFEGSNALPNLLKRRYGKVAQTFPQKFELYQWLMSAPSFSFKNRDFLFPVITSPGGAYSAYAEGGKFPGGVPPGIVDAKVPIKQTSTTVTFSNLQMMLGKDDADGFLRNTDMIVKLNIEAYKRKTNIGLYGLHQVSLVGGAAPVTLQGLNGVINHITAVAGGPPVTAITVDRPLGYANADLGSARYTKHLMENDILSYGSIAGTTYTTKGHFRVTAVNRATNVVTISSLSSAGGQPAADDWISFCDFDVATNNSYGRMPQGFGALLYQGADAGAGVGQLIQEVPVSASDAYGWSTQQITSAGPFDQTEWHQMLRNIAIASGSNEAAIVNDPTMKDTYAGTIIPDQRLLAQDAKGGFKEPEFSSGRPYKLIYDQSCPYGISFFLSKEEVFWLKTMNEPAWDNSGGSQWKALQFQDAVYGVFKWYYNLGFQKLNSHGVVKGISIANAPI